MIDPYQGVHVRFVARVAAPNPFRYDTTVRLEFSPIRQMKPRGSIGIPFGFQYNCDFN